MILLTQENLKEYLTGKKLLNKKEKAEITLLQGGNVNTIFRIKTKTKEFVLKQILEEPHNKIFFLKAVKFDKNRILLEMKMMQTIHKILTDPHVPKLLFSDVENSIIIMTSVSSSAKLYQSELFEGRFHFDQAYQLGEFNAKLHSATYLNKEVEALFQERIGLELRGYTIIPAFGKFPTHKKKFEEAFEKARKNKFCLVDADITHKNILLHDNTFTKLDFETVHYGDPALDVAIMFAHYLLPAFVYPQWKKEYLLAAALYWYGYQKNVTFTIPKAFFTNMKNYCALMMLGRIDSDVVFSWLSGHEDEVRAIALGIFDADITNINQLLSFVEKN
jgi:5-methylthioribose kinase